MLAMATAMENINPSTEYVPGQYIMRIDENVYNTNIDVQNFLESLENELKIYTVRTNTIGSLRLVLVKGEHEDVMAARNLRGVQYIEQNQVVRFLQCEEQPAPGQWGLDRIDQRKPLRYSEPVSEDGEYTWGAHTGSSAVAYVLDTGIDIEHNDFEGRASWGYTAPDIINDFDQHGHGTSIAGIIGGNTHGIAKSVALVAVKVLDDFGNGSWDQSIAGLDYVVLQHQERSSPCIQAKSVVNMSIGGWGYKPIDDAVAAAVEEGVVVVVAAGNSESDACGYSPAREPTAITVGAFNINDFSLSYSNYGPCVDIFAPGVNILSAILDQESEYRSGTSMAAAHVAGVVARYQDSHVVTPSPKTVSIQ